MKKAIIVHRWDGSPDADWYPWIKRELEDKNFKVFVPEMPSAEKPEIHSWVSFLKEKVGIPDGETVFVGHSVGCQTILRFLETLPKNVKVRGVVLVAGWMNLTPEALEEEGSEEIARPWMETPINWDKVKLHSEKFVCIFSGSDPFVPLSDSKIFEKKLNAEILIEMEQGHFNMLEVPVVLEVLLKLT